MQTLARTLFLALLGHIRRGRISVCEGAEHREFGEPESTLRAKLVVHDPRFYLDALLGGSVGAGRSFMQRRWSTDDLTALVRILARNGSVLQRWRRGPARIPAPLHRLFLWARRNTIRGSRRNIAAHYDLSNEFFALFLDPRMMYSCAWFETPQSSLADAALAKIDRVCRKLQLNAKDSLLEIGTGWGGLAVHAAEKYGCRVTTTTISRQQFDYTSHLVHQRGLQDRVTVLLEDYRNLSGSFDKLVSIEMIEAVGAEYLGQYFQTCSRLLGSNGLMLLQAITIDDRHFEQAARSVDFIKRYIFPGSCIPSLQRIETALKYATDLRIAHAEDLTLHYARTLRLWRERFLANRSHVLDLGFDEDFVRMWEFYFCYCEGGFLEGRIGDVQLVLGKPACDLQSLSESLASLPGDHGHGMD